MAASTATQVLRLRRDATLTPPADDAASLRLDFPGGYATWPGLTPGRRAALLALAAGDVLPADLAGLAAVAPGAGNTGGDPGAGSAGGDPEAGNTGGGPGGGNAAEQAWVDATLAALDGAGLLEHAVHHGGAELARLRPVGRGRYAPAPPPAPDTPVKLSRFALARAEGGRLVVAAPDSPRQVELAPAAAGILGPLATWTPAGDVAGSIPAGGAVLELLAGAGTLAPGGPGASPEDDDRDRAQWSVTDRWLHARSRGTRLAAGYGGTYALATRYAPLPAAPSPRGTTRIPLAAPDLAVLATADPPLSQVLEARRSVRAHHDAAPITADALGELLYRTARIRRTFPGEHGQDLVDRPYPAGGAIHELEVYPLVTRCAGLPPGLWHYAAADHALELVAAPGPATGILVGQARAASQLPADPQVLLVITARFGRLMWKYESIAYALLLKHVGVLYQTVYLVGTAMGLAVCGLGAGDGADFAAASGLDPFAEGSVGEIVLGSRA